MTFNLARYRALLTDAEFEEMQAAIQRPLPPALRVNTLKIDLETAHSTWPVEYGWQVQPVAFCASGWQIDGQPRNLSRTIEHRTGFYYIQDAASMLPAELFSYDREFPLVLDMAASPGGKTTQLASKIDDRGLIVANDSSAGRIAALRSNLQTWGTLSTVLTSYSGERFGGWFPNTFDKVLLDAPCSGESLRTAERRKTRFVSAKERLQLQQRQIKLLTSAFHAAKPDGQIVYATCTLAPEEDEAVIDALLKSFPQLAAIESVRHILPVPAPALKSDGDHEFHPALSHAVRLWPHLYDTSGFFAALISKHAASPVESSPAPERSLSQAGFSAPGRAQQRMLITRLRDAYGFDLGTVLERQRLELLQRAGSVYAVPVRWLSSFSDFPCIAPGMLIGEWHEDTLIPSHELIARFSGQFSGQRLMLSADQVKLWLNGADLRGLDHLPYPAGSVIVLEDEKHRYIGRGKVLRDRLRNLLPKS